MNSFAYFSSPIYREEIPLLVESTREASERYFQDAKKYQSGALIQTDSMVQDDSLRNLANNFVKTGIDILRSQGYLVKNYEFYLSGMWGQEFMPGGVNIMHTHSDSQISGLYFIEAPENGAYPFFDDPRPGKKMCDLDFAESEEVTMATPMIHFNNMAAGTLLVFNSWLPHSIGFSRSENPTKFIHFILSHRRMK